MSAIKMTVHRLEQNGICSLSGKEGEVLVVSFDDGTLSEGTLSQRSLMQLLRMKLGQNGKKPIIPVAVKAEPVNAAAPK